MASKKKNKQKRVASVDEYGIVKRDLLKTAFWIGIATLSVMVFALVQRNFFP